MLTDALTYVEPHVRTCGNETLCPLYAAAPRTATSSARALMGAEVANSTHP